MKNIIFLFSILICINFGTLGNQNSGAGIRFDLNTSSSGNQNQINISCPGTNTFVRVDIYVVNASNLDTYEFNISYDAGSLQFIGGAEDQPITNETNFLKKNGGSTIGFTCTANSGNVNCANTLVGDQGDNTPDGDGLLASINFKALVNCPGQLNFGDVVWSDNSGLQDICTDKGGNAVLPIELSSFTGKSVEEKIMLHWVTKTEVNNYGFELERALSNNKIWERVGFVKGNGNSYSSKEYSFTDNNPSGGSNFIYRLKQIDNDGKFVYSDEIEIEIIPTKYELFQNYPNPFNPITNFKFEIVNHGLVTLKVYDMLGNEITTIINKELDPGFYKFQWDASNFATGVYFYCLHAGDYINTKKLLLIK
jgi:Secretion system C-terminal sorting domain/Cohesin domain